VVTIGGDEQNVVAITKGFAVVCAGAYSCVPIEEVTAPNYPRGPILQKVDSAGIIGVLNPW
jgi:hypothetical protein